MIIGEITVMHQSFVHADEWMGSSRVPDPPFRRIALMSDPAVCLEILQKIILGHLFRISDDLEDHHIPPVREDERLLLSQGGIVLMVYPIRILIDEFIFNFFWVHCFNSVFDGKTIQNSWFNPDEISPHVRRVDAEPVNFSKIIHRGDPFSFMDFHTRGDTGFFKSASATLIQEGDLEQIMGVQYVLIDPKAFRGESDGCNPTTFSVSAALHLKRGFINVAA